MITRKMKRWVWKLIAASILGGMAVMWFILKYSGVCR